MERKNLEIISSLLVVIFTIISITIFIYYGGNTAFYIAIFTALAIAFFNGWYISNPEKFGHEVFHIFRVHRAPTAFSGAARRVQKRVKASRRRRH